MINFNLKPDVVRYACRFRISRRSGSFNETFIVPAGDMLALSHALDEMTERLDRDAGIVAWQLLSLSKVETEHFERRDQSPLR